VWQQLNEVLLAWMLWAVAQDVSDDHEVAGR
jgi:hypothetical protein